MKDYEPIEHGYISPWFTTPVNLPANNDYFPHDYPIDEKLVMPAPSTKGTSKP